MAQYELNLRDYWQIIQRRRYIFLAVFILVFVCDVVYTNSLKPVYQAGSSVQFVQRKTLGSMLTELVVESSGDPLATQSRIITSLPVMERVVVDLGLAGKNPSQTDILDKANELLGMVSTSVISDTSIIRITVTGQDPKLVSDAANKIAEEYVAENLKEKTKESRSVREFIEKQLEEVGGKLKISEEALSAFKERETPSGVAVSLENRLADLETKRNELLKLYTPAHPDVKNNEDQISQTKVQMKTLPEKELVYGRLMREVEIDNAIYRDLKTKLAAARINEAEKVEDVNIIDSAYPPDAPVSPKKSLNYLVGLIMGVVLGITATSLVEQLDTSIGTIEDVENFIKLPALGVIPYLRTKDDKKGIMQLLFPKEFKGKDRYEHLRNQLVVHYSNSSPTFEAYRILRTNIQNEVFKKEPLKGKVILFSSSGPEEGKSITISNLSISMAQGNFRTLLIDADMRRSVTHNIFGIKSREPGLSNVLRGEIRPDNAIKTFADILMGSLGFDDALKLPGLDNLNILTSGSLPTLPAELLSSPEMPKMLEELRTKFDIILIDSPPILAVADAAIIGTNVDAAILVYRVGRTARSVLARAKAQLVDSGAPVKGIVLNNISPEIEMRYGYYYHYKYYGKYYSEKKTGT
jgi:polysaccharide biosynthesis transport protein